MMHMPTDAEITFADHAGRLYARRYGMAPVVGRLLGYLAICDPREQSIAELAEALLASRSAIAGAVKTLEQLGLVRRSRAAGERMDRVGIDLTSRRALGFDPTEYQEQAALARDGRVAGGTAARVGEGLAGPPRDAARGGRTPRRHDPFLTARRHDDPVQRGDYRPRDTQVLRRPGRAGRRRPGG